MISLYDSIRFINFFAGVFFCFLLACLPVVLFVAVVLPVSAFGGLCFAFFWLCLGVGL